MFKFVSPYGEEYENCKFEKRGDKDHIAYLITNSEQEAIMKLNIPGYTYALPEKLRNDNVVVMLDEKLDFLKKLDVVNRTHGYLQLSKIGSFYDDVPVVELDTEKLMKLNDCKEISFEEGVVLDRDGNVPRKTPVISISEWDKYIVTLDNQEGYTVKKDEEPYIVKVQNVAHTTLECRPVEGKKDIFHVTEKSSVLEPIFGGVIQDFYAKIDNELLKAMGADIDRMEAAMDNTKDAKWYSAGCKIKGFEKVHDFDSAITVDSFEFAGFAKQVMVEKSEDTKDIWVHNGLVLPEGKTEILFEVEGSELDHHISCEPVKGVPGLYSAVDTVVDKHNPYEPERDIEYYLAIDAERLAKQLSIAKDNVVSVKEALVSKDNHVLDRKDVDNVKVQKNVKASLKLKEKQRDNSLSANKTAGNVRE